MATSFGILRNDYFSAKTITNRQFLNISIIETYDLLPVAGP